MKRLKRAKKQKNKDHDKKYKVSSNAILDEYQKIKSVKVKGSCRKYPTKIALNFQDKNFYYFELVLTTFDSNTDNLYSFKR